MSQALGWRFVPPTVIRDATLGIGMVQLFVDHDPSEHYLTLAPAYPDLFRRVAAFDIVINNADRKSGHCLLQRGRERIWVVDHGVTFHASPKLRTVIWDFAGEPLPDDVLVDLRRLTGDLAAGPLREQLRTLLGDEEVNAMSRRIDALTKAAAYPEPGPGRPYPWPPI